MSIQIDFTDKELQAVKTFAEQTGVPVDTYIKQVLLNYIDGLEEAEDLPFIMQGLQEVRQGKYIDGNAFIDGIIGKYDNI